MPELPEAETIRCQLEREIIGARVRRLTVHIPRIAREHSSTQELKKLVEGRQIERVGRRGKALLIHLNGKKATTLIVRLGMTGLLRVVPAEEPMANGTAATLELGDGRHLRFLDQRLFGALIARSGHDVDRIPEFEDYGPDPLSDLFTLDYLKEVLARRTANLENVLMDQHVIAGVGKIYADEICFRAGLRPGRRARGLTGPMRERLWRAVREVLSSAIECRGSSAADETYRDVYGMPGSFQERHCVYQRTGEPCRVCTSAIRRTRMPGGRGMHWCPTCQK
jgi:formamidopyrimidine-DNA glycosylase